MKNIKIVDSKKLIFLLIEGSKASSVLAGGEPDSGRNALRKNKAFLQLQREMEQRERLKRKTANEEEEEEVGEVSYVDRDRGAAVVIGNKDIKKDLNVSKCQEQQEIKEAETTNLLTPFSSIRRNVTARKMRPRLS